MALPLLPLQQCAPFSASPPSTPLRAYVPPSERGDGDGGDHGNVEDGLATAFVHNYCSINSSDGVGGGDGDGDAKAFDREDDGTPKTVFGDVDTLSSIRFDDSWLETAKDGGNILKKTVFFMTLFNLNSDLVSVGTLSTPLYLQQAGVWFSALLIPLFAVLAIWTLWIVYEAAMLYPEAKDFPALNRLAWGRWGKLCDALCAISIFLLNFLAFVGFLMSLPLILPDLIALVWTDAPLWTSNRNVILVFSVALLSPLAFFKSLANYAFISLVCFVLVYTFIGIVLLAAAGVEFNYGAAGVPFSELSVFGDQIVVALGGYAYLFACHDLSVEVIHSMRNPSRKRYFALICCAIGLSAVTQLLIGFGGNLMFVGDVQSDILNNFPPSSTAANVARSAEVLTIVISQPFNAFMPRLSLRSLLELSFEVMGYGHVIAEHSNVVHIILTVTVLYLALLLSVLITDLGTVFSLAGGIAGVSIAYVFPGILGYRLVYKSNVLRVASLVIMSIGLCAMVLTVVPYL